MIEEQEPSGSPLEDNIEDGQADDLVETQPQVTIEHRQGEPVESPNEKVYLPALLSDEFGVSQSVAREQIALGDITIDGEEVDRRGRLDYDVEELDGKLIEVVGRDRQFRMTYDHARHMSRKENFR